MTANLRTVLRLMLFPLTFQQVEHLALKGGVLRLMVSHVLLAEA
jgi:hypothetical protein